MIKGMMGFDIKFWVNLVLGRIIMDVEKKKKRKNRIKKLIVIDGVIFVLIITCISIINLSTTEGSQLSSHESTSVFGEENNTVSNVSDTFEETSKVGVTTALGALVNSAESSGNDSQEKLDNEGQGQTEQGQIEKEQAEPEKVGNGKETDNSGQASAEQVTEKETKKEIATDNQIEADQEQQNQEQKDGEQLKKEAEVKEVVEGADLLAAGYDYDGAIKKIKAYDKNYLQNEVLAALVQTYKEEKKKLVPFGAYESSSEVSHIFFHSLIYDTGKAFDQDYDSNGYNYYMTTVSEFKAMMQQMYEKDYVLVSIHDVASQVTLEDGTTTYQDGNIMLPPDKKPFVLSQDDVNYYDYMDGDGFASRIIVDENGKLATEMILEDGSTVTGAFDMVPVLEEFIEEHPDFSYHGARGIIALTGYEGTLGYRTDPASKDSKTYKNDIQTVKKVAKAMKEQGWEFACHSNGHRNLQERSYEFLVNDTINWTEYVGNLIGGTDIYIFPYGIDIQSGSKAYSNDKYQYLKESGFNYFCGVYKDPWIQVKKDYVRMTRRPLDGQAMLQFPERLADLFDLSSIIDPARPELK